MLLVCISPKQNIFFFWEIWLKVLDFYKENYENLCILDNSNPTSSKFCLIIYLGDLELKSLIRKPTCFKSWRKTNIYLILLCSVFKIKFEQVPPKVIPCHSYRNIFKNQDFVNFLMTTHKVLENLQETLRQVYIKI